MKKIQIAIDGPAGAGKSTVARQVASALGYLYIDTGAMYRALTYEAIKSHVSFSDSRNLRKLLENTTIELVQTKEGQDVFVNQRNVTNEIRSPEVTNNVSLVAVHEEVRTEMVNRQQLLAQDGGVVMDGRDIGTCVLKDAALKVYLDASVEERAKRRFAELEKQGIEISLEQLQKEIEMRDKHDSEREIAPLKKADDAIAIDSTRLTIEEVVQEILTLAEERK